MKKFIAIVLGLMLLSVGAMATAAQTATAIVNATSTAVQAKKTAIVLTVVAYSTPGAKATAISAHRTQTAVAGISNATLTLTAIAKMNATRTAIINAYGTSTAVAILSATITPTNTSVPTPLATTVICGSGPHIYRIGQKSLNGIFNVYNANAASLTWTYALKDVSVTADAATAPVVMTITANTGNVDFKAVGFKRGVCIDFGANTECVAIKVNTSNSGY